MPEPNINRHFQSIADIAASFGEVEAKRLVAYKYQRLLIISYMAAAATVAAVSFTLVGMDIYRMLKPDAPGMIAPGESRQNAIRFHAPCPDP
jgi:hypothetical protein